MNMKEIEAVEKVIKLREMFEKAFKDHDVVTTKDIYECLASYGHPCHPIIAGGVVYNAMRELGFGKEGECFRKKFSNPQLRNALVQVIREAEPTAAPAPLPIARTDFEDGEPRVRDLDLAVFLNYKEPRQIRKLIKSHQEHLRGFGDLVCRGATHRQSTYNGATREYTVDETWLTEHQAVHICAKSETPIANSILKQVIEVFVQARRDASKITALQGQPISDALTAVLTAVAEAQKTQTAMMARVVDLLEAKPAPSTSYVAPKPTVTVDPFPHSLNWVPVFQWTAANGINMTKRERGTLGAYATRIMRKLGLTPRQKETGNTKYPGRLINLYPGNILTEAWGQMSSKQRAVAVGQ